MSGIIFGSGITLSAGITVGQGGPATSGGYIDLFGSNFSTPDTAISDTGCLVYDSLNNLYMVGYTDGGNIGLVSKFDVNGAIQWQRTLSTSSPNMTVFLSVDVDNSNNVYVTGQTTSDGTTDGADVQIVKYDTNGNLQWQKTLGGTYYHNGTSVVVDNNTGDFYVCGSFLTSSGFPQNFRILLLKYDSSGVLQWQTGLTPAVSSDQATSSSIALDSAGNVYIVGSTPTSTTSGQGLLIKYNSSGALQWQVGLSKATGQGEYLGISIDGSDNIFVCGTVLTGIGGTSYGVVAKYNTSGVLQWKKQLGDSSASPYLQDIVADSSGNIYTTGYGGINNSSYIIKLDTSGSILWQRNLSASSYWAMMYSIAIDSLDNIVTGGYSRPTGGGGNNQILMLRVPNDGSPTGTYTASGISFTYSISSLPIADLSAWSTANTSLTNGTTSFTVATSTLSSATSTFTNVVTPIPTPTPVPGVDNVTGYTQMQPPIIPGNQLEDSTATINGSTGFTINDDGATGIAIGGLTASNTTWFAANYTTGNYYNVTWGPGSTVASSSIYVTQVPGGWPGSLVFFVQGQTGAATYNYPFTFSV